MRNRDDDDGLFTSQPERLLSLIVISAKIIATAVALTVIGFMVATYNGPNRYDGTTFKKPYQQPYLGDASKIAGEKVRP